MSQTFDRLLGRHPQPMWIHDADTRAILAVNDAALRVYGYSREQFLKMNAADLDAGDGSGRHRLADGRLIDVETESGCVRLGRREGVLVAARDVTDQRTLRDRLEHHALHDPLTGLANTVLLRDRIRHACDTAPSRAGRQPALLVFDLDGFKTVNDTLGHAAGDRVIAVTAARIARVLKARDTAARLGGDEFAVLLNEMRSTAEAQKVARRLLAAIGRPMTIAGQSVMVTASCGLAVPSTLHRAPEDLLGDADIAMYVAKSKGSGTCVVFDQSFRDAVVERLTMRRELADAVARGQLHVVYQPQVELVSGRVVAAEALVRWTHPERGPVPPDVFIPVAEQIGVVTAIDTWVLHSACAALRGWMDAGLPGMRVAVNISGRDLESDELVPAVRAALRDHDLEPWRLELELTETVAMTQPDAAVARLHELRRIGVRIAIDDFGTGFSMLSRLRQLPIDRLKIDRTFVLDLDRDDDAFTIVRSTVSLAHALGLDIVAEGVETSEIASALRRLECDGAQGYHFARPLAADALQAWLSEREGAAAPRLSLVS